MADALLSFDGVTKRYQSGDFWRPVKAQALRGVDLEIRPGEVFGLVGLNGAGKSTLMKMAVGLLRPDSGKVRLFGFDPGSLEARRRFGYLPELPSFPSYLSALEVITYYARLHGLPQAVARARQVLEQVGLKAALDEPIRRYSKGMQQRVGLAQALLHGPELLFLDEPMSGLDPLGMSEMREIILDQRRQGRTVLFNSHVLAEVERISDRVGHMHRGKMLWVAPVAEIEARAAAAGKTGKPPLETVFLNALQGAAHD